MMGEVGVRELKARATEIVRNVRDRRARYTVTYRGRPVGVLLPIDTVAGSVRVAPPEDDLVWDELTRLGEEIAKSWRSPLSSVELLSSMRR
jgi:prevent-host-death family protein